MENWETFIKTILDQMGFADYSVDIDREHRHAAVFIHEDHTLIKENLPVIIESMNHLVQLIGRKNNEPPIFLDVNNYRHERESLIVELARATARKALATKTEIPLPAMNSYERRIAHVELAAHPDVMTESFGKGHERYVVVKPIFEKKEEVKTETAP